MSSIYQRHTNPPRPTMRMARSYSENDTPATRSSANPRRTASITNPTTGTNPARTTTRATNVATKPSLNETARRPASGTGSAQRASSTPSSTMPFGAGHRQNSMMASRVPSSATMKRKGSSKGSKTVEDDSDANKENIAPMRLTSLTNNITTLSRSASTRSGPTARRRTGVASLTGGSSGPRRLYSDSFATSALVGLEKVEIRDGDSSDEEGLGLKSKKEVDSKVKETNSFGSVKSFAPERTDAPAFNFKGLLEVYGGASDDSDSESDLSSASDADFDSMLDAMFDGLHL